MPKIFLSHAVADAALAKLLTNFLKEGMGVPQDAIFASSVSGHGIPFGEDFNTYIKEQIQEPELVILLMTPSYMESWFCLMELGAAWVQSNRTLPIVTPGVDFKAVMATLGPKQGWNITDAKGLNDLRAMVRSAVSDLEKRSDHVWDEKRDRWILDLRKVLKALPAASKVDAAVHADVVE